MNLYYFTGTGNSIAVCREIQKHFPVAKPVNIATLTGKASVRDPATIIGLVLPTYYMDVPDIARDFLERLETAEDAYIFASVHFGLQPGNILATLSEIMKRKGPGLALGWKVQLPDNSIAFRTPLEEQPGMHRTMPETVREMCEAIRRGERNETEPRSKAAAAMAGMSRFVLRHILGAARKKATGECTGCGICSRICPTENISIVERKPVFGKDCAECFGCIHWCPEGAVRYGMLKLNERSRYTHPDVEVKELFLRK